MRVKFEYCECGCKSFVSVTPGLPTYWIERSGGKYILWDSHHKNSRVGSFDDMEDIKAYFANK